MISSCSAGLKVQPSPLKLGSCGSLSGTICSYSTISFIGVLLVELFRHHSRNTATAVLSDRAVINHLFGEFDRLFVCRGVRSIRERDFDGLIRLGNPFAVGAAYSSAPLTRCPLIKVDAIPAIEDHRVPIVEPSWRTFSGRKLARRRPAAELRMPSCAPDVVQPLAVEGKPLLDGLTLHVR